MRHLRKDYDAIQPWPTKRPHIIKRDGEPLEVVGWLGQDQPVIPDDEPVFLLRAKDKFAPHLVRMWANLVEEATYTEDQTLSGRVRQWADEMQAYAAEHYDGGKVPDTPEGLLKP